jgi:Transposase, Mutator family
MHRLPISHLPVARSLFGGRQAGETTPTDPRSRRNRASRRGGQLLTRAHGPPNKNGLPDLFSPRCPSSRTVAPYSPASRLQTLDRSWAEAGTGTFIPVTNSIESLNYQLRKIIKNRGHFPNDDAVIKLLWLAIRDIEDKRRRIREKERGKPANQRTAPPRLVEGAVVQGWRAALNQLELLYPDRLAGQIN